MSGPSKADPRPIESRDDLVEALAKGEKPRHAWRIGTEHEKFVFNPATAQRVPYEGDAGIRALLEGLIPAGWEPIREGDAIIGLTKGGASVSLEPGGQFELSGAPLETLHQTCDEVHSHLAELKPLTERLGLLLVGLGSDPFSRREDLAWMPKARYGIMRAYMPTRGTLGHEMMLNTTTIQVNLDFSSETDLVQKLRVGLALQPLATALFANGPLRHGTTSGYKSFRGQVWTDTDPDRTGGLAWAFEEGMGYEAYVDYALDVPMYFVTREGKPVNMAGQSFRRFLDQGLEALPGERPTRQDWSDHLTTLFPDVRVKSFLEMRGADGGPWANICALPAFWVGLLYDQDALDAASNLIASWTAEEREALRNSVPLTGLDTDFRGKPLWELAEEVLSLSEAGLRARGAAGKVSSDETEYLSVLQDLVAKREHPADRALAAWQAVEQNPRAFLEALAF